MRSLSVSGNPRPRPRLSTDIIPPFPDRRLSYLTRSNALNRGPRSFPTAASGHDAEESHPSALSSLHTPTQPSDDTNLSSGSSKGPLRESSIRTHDEPGEPSIRSSLAVTCLDKAEKATKPHTSESEIIQQLRREKCALEQHNRALEDNVKQILDSLRSWGYEVDSFSELGRRCNTATITMGTRQQELLPSAASNSTPRVILLLKLLERQLGKQDSSGASHLDKILDPKQAADFAGVLDAHHHLLAPRSAWIKVCALCQVPRFQGVPVASPISDPALTLFVRPPSESYDIFNEFHSSPLGTTPCCSEFICDTCYARGICSSFKKDFWFDLDSEYWIKCPFPPCRTTLPLRYNVEVTSMLRSLNDPEILIHTTQFERANSLRAAICALDPVPRPNALVRASRLAHRLQNRGYMSDPFAIKEALDIEAIMVPVDSVDGSETLQVPIFPGLLIPAGSSSTESQNGRECTVCTETLVDFADGTPEDEARWEAATNAFPGDWRWLVRSFPTPYSLPACSTNHTLDICNACLERHLTTQIESRGRAALESLSCPYPGCGHAYSHEEIRMLASSEVFSRYDKLRLLGHIATLPDFRWCLSESCDMGQVYHFPRMPSFPDTRHRSRVVCDACGFEMCFYHQVPWHKDQTCVDYDADRGDPESEATEEWLRQNTKPCPGMCGASVEKKGGCFHMTCQVCRFEFCWECLSDWSVIANVDPVTNRRRYRRDAHNEGCYFRGENAPEATMVAGNTVGDALRGYL